MTTTTIASPPLRTSDSGAWRHYARLWGQAPRSALFLLAGFVLAMVSLTVLSALFSAGVGMLVLIVGLPVVLGSLIAARWFGVAHGELLVIGGTSRIAEPEWNRDDPSRGGWWWTFSRPLRNARYWTALLHGMVVSPIVSTIAFTIGLVWVSMALGGLSYWIWAPFTDRVVDQAYWGAHVIDAVPVLEGWSPWTVEVVLTLVAGVVFTVTMPWVLRGLTVAQHDVARALLGRWRSDDLAAEVRAEALARQAAAHAEDVSLRKLERDIHDGPQQRLVRIQLDVAAWQRRTAEGDAAGAEALASGVREQAQAALDELRALSSGVAPPILQDRGLAAALESFGRGGDLPVRVSIDPSVDARIDAPAARSVYFVVAELIANATKHACAQVIELVVDASGEAGMLVVRVTDDGVGGACAVPGHGLAGVEERVAGLRGAVEVTSPAGGPTSIVVRIPAMNLLDG